MRTNLPVTQHNHDFPADQTLISVTDTKGRITYCNDNFIAVSGYTKDELMGQPHNLVRHPDMPEEAFRDMWETIQTQGKPWSALVKNRRKNGDHYWVRANATPVRNGDQIVGFLSVRTKPSEKEIATFEQLYETMRAEAAAGRLKHVLDSGVVKRRGLLPSLARALTPGLRGKLMWLSALAALGPVVGIAFGLPLLAIVVPAMLVPTLLGARLYHGISEARFRQIVLGMLTLSGVAMLVVGLPRVLARAG